MEVSIESRKMVGPRATTPDHLRRYTISSIDQLQTTGYVGLLLIYRPVNDSAFDCGSVHRLEESLSEALTIYYPLAGRYVEDGCYIDCRGQGVELVEARVNGHLDRLTAFGQGIDLDLLNQLCTYPDRVEDNPLMIIQVNKFECGGLAFCLRFTHMVVDSHSIIAFVDAWAMIGRGSSPGEVVTPNFDVSCIFPPQNSVIIPPFARKPRSDKLVMRKFTLSRETLAQLAIETVADEPDMKLERYGRPSRFEIAFALLCKALVKIDRDRNHCARPITISFPMNLRGRTSVAIPDAGFGNICTMGCDTLSSMGDEERNLHGYIKIVTEIIRKTKARYEAIGTAEELWSMVQEDIKRCLLIQMSRKHCIVHTTSWRFPLYGIDFGWGGPELVVLCLASRTTLLMDGKEDGGIDAWVVLDEEEMAKFKGDEDIIKHCMRSHQIRCLL